MTPKKSILILSSSYLQKDPRVLRQIRALKDDYKIITCGITSSNIDGLKEYPILFRPSKQNPFLRRVKNYIQIKSGNYNNLTWDRSVFKTLNKENFDLIIVNDPREMPLAVALHKEKPACKIYFDSHEYYNHVDSNPLFNKMYSSLLAKYYNSADKTSTVNQEIAHLYEEQFGGECRVVKNAGPYKNLSVQDVDENTIKLVHHGVLNRDRKLEKMVDMINSLDDSYVMDFYLVGSDQSYLEQLKNRVKNKSKVQFKDPVPFDKLVDTLNKYDIGVFILDPKVKSYELALPNKIFEFIQARLAIAISPNIAMKNLVEKWENGIVADDYTGEDLVKKIMATSIEDLNRFKINSNRAALFENEEEGVKVIQEIISDLID